MNLHVTDHEAVTNITYLTFHCHLVRKMVSKYINKYFNVIYQITTAIWKMIFFKDYSFFL